MARKVSELMAPAPVSLRASQTLKEAAAKMRENGVGAMLVVDDGQLRGLVTDRDIVAQHVGDYVAAVALGIVFQHFAIAPMRGLPPGKALVEARCGSQGRCGQGPGMASSPPSWRRRLRRTAFRAPAYRQRPGQGDGRRRSGTRRPAG